MGILKRRTPWEAAYHAAWQQEEKFLYRYALKPENALIAKIEEKAPEKLLETLHGAFMKAFDVVFEKGTGPILKAAKIEDRRVDYAKNACAADIREDKKNLRAFSRAAVRAGRGNVLLSGAAGIGMGAFGVMLPDVPLFTALLLKSIYETAESYGFHAEKEQLYVLRLMDAALSYGEELRRKSAVLDRYAQTGFWPDGPKPAGEKAAAARALSEAALYAKVVQNVPLIGAAGGAANAVIAERVRKFADIKYRKRFLIRRKLGAQF